MPPVKNANDSIAIYIAKILFAILILLAFFMTYLIILDRDSQFYGSGASKLRATPNTTSYFLSNQYESGSTPFEIEAEDGAFLGVDRNASVLAVNVEQSSNEDKDSAHLLQIFDTTTREKRHELIAAGCSNVSSNNIVYCHDTDAGKIHGINVLNGEPMMSFNASKKASQAQLLGSQQGGDIVQVRSTEKDKPSNELYAIVGNNVRWSQTLDPKEACSVIDKARTIICQQPQDGGGKSSPKSTKIRTLRAATGTEIASRRTEAEIALTSDGWMEKSEDQQRDAHPTTAAFTSHVSVNKANVTPLPEPNKIFGIDAQEKGTAQAWGGNTFYPSESSDKAGNTLTLAYPSHVIEAMNFNTGGIVTADGEVTLIRVPSYNPDDYSYARLGGPDIVFSISADDKILTTSKNGALVLLKLDNSANKNNDVFTLYDTKTRSSVLDIEDSGADEVDVINGFLAVTQKSKNGKKFEKLVVYLPNAR